MKFLKTISIFLMLFIIFNLIQATPSIVKAESNTQQTQTIQKSNEQPKKLQLSQTNKKFLGVCGGIAEYFEIDATIVRICWGISVLVFGTGVVLYFICYFCMK